jgi:predicted hydrocarbon binding protein
MEKTKKKEEALMLLSRLKSKEKWGKISFRNVDYTRGSGRIIIFNSFETAAKDGSRLGCHFLRGFLAGFLSELFEKENIEVVEEKCASKGYSHCEFKFASSFAFYAKQARQVVKSVIREAALKYPSDIK